MIFEQEKTENFGFIQVQSGAAPAQKQALPGNCGQGFFVDNLK
jgi:hypothetical protein